MEWFERKSVKRLKTKRQIRNSKGANTEASCKEVLGFDLLQTQYRSPARVCNIVSPRREAG